MKQTRATFVIDPVVLRQFKQFAKDKKKSLSNLVEQGMKKVMEDADGNDLDKQYDVLMEMAGKGKASSPELANMSVDELLYGEYDGWLGGRD
tara:strand:- start:31 stop:306 length:276 start_codon:yes stop_codon:yes gene_type:complete